MWVCLTAVAVSKQRYALYVKHLWYCCRGVNEILSQLAALEMTPSSTIEDFQWLLAHLEYAICSIFSPLKLKNYADKNIW